MAKMIGLEKAMKNLNERIRKVAKDANVELVVGYNAPHALIVHEDEDMLHPNGGQAKYLEEPATRNGVRYGKLVAEAIKAGKTMRQALMAAGTALKLDSQALVPVDTGELKASAYVRADIGAAAKASKAAKKGKRKRKTQHG